MTKLAFERDWKRKMPLIVDAEEREGGWRAIAAKKPNNLNQQRLSSVTQVLKRYDAKRVVDLGCGEGNLLRALISENTFDKLTGV